MEYLNFLNSHNVVSFDDVKQLLNDSILLKEWLSPTINETISISLQTDPYTHSGTFNATIGLFLYMSSLSESPPTSNIKGSFTSEGTEIEGILIKNLPSILDNQNFVSSTTLTHPITEALTLTFSESNNHIAKAKTSGWQVFTS